MLWLVLVSLSFITELLSQFMPVGCTKAHGLHHQLYYVYTEPTINDCMRDLKASLDGRPKEERVIGFECEWVVTKRPGEPEHPVCIGTNWVYCGLSGFILRLWAVLRRMWCWQLRSMLAVTGSAATVLAVACGVGSHGVGSCVRCWQSQGSAAPHAVLAVACSVGSHGQLNAWQLQLGI
jgi:hypothetical protein